jgi:hypothetical protein
LQIYKILRRIYYSVRVMRALLFAMVLASVACSSSTGPSDTGGNGNGACSGNASTPNSTLTATIDGVPWRPVSVVGRRGSPNGDAYLQVDSVDANCNLLGFAAAPLNGPLTVGTIQIGASASNASYVTVGGTPTWTAALSRGSGTINVTNFSLTNKTAAGTFNFVLVGPSSSKTVTNGVFSVTFP